MQFLIDECLSGALALLAGRLAAERGVGIGEVAQSAFHVPLSREMMR